MIRIALISTVILPVLLWFGFHARKKNQQSLAIGLFTAAAVYILLLIGSFAGVIGG